MKLATIMPTPAARSFGSKVQYDLYVAAAEDLVVKSLNRAFAACSGILVSWSPIIEMGLLMRSSSRFSNLTGLLMPRTLIDAMEIVCVVSSRFGDD